MACSARSDWFCGNFRSWPSWPFNQHTPSSAVVLANIFTNLSTTRFYFHYIFNIFLIIFVWFKIRNKITLIKKHNKITLINIRVTSGKQQSGRGAAKFYNKHYSFLLNEPFLIVFALKFAKIPKKMLFVKISIRNILLGDK